MTVKRIRKGRYIAHGCFKDGKPKDVSDTILIEYDPETRFWYAEDYFTGKAVCDCERHLYEIKERIS